MKIKKLLFLPLVALISSCSYITPFLPSFSSSNYGSLIIDETNPNIVQPEFSDVEYTNISPLHEVLYEDEDIHIGLPSSGDVNVLVVPVEIGNEKFSDKDLANLEIAFNGSSIETGFESVQSYYKESSNGYLNIQATISPVFQTGLSENYFESRYAIGRDIEWDILDNVLPLLDEYYDLSLFDYNKDSYIDGIYLIYSCDYSLDDNNPWWAWCYTHNDNEATYDNVKPHYYVWASKEFMYDPLVSGEEINVNSETYIHETGHLLGLDDYYDYSPNIGPKGGIGGAAMMDSNVGDHDPFSKLMLGWIKPKVFCFTDDDNTFILNSVNHCLIVPLRDNKDDYFGEYLLIDYYKPTRLNEQHAGYSGLFTIPGVRIYHVDSRIDPNLGNQKNNYGYYTIFSYNNSDTNHHLIKMVEYDNNNSINKIGYASNSDLFPSESMLSNYANYDGDKLDRTIKISFNNTYATIKIES